MMTNMTGFSKHAERVGMKTSDIDQTLSNRTFDRHRDTNSIRSSPGQAQVVLYTVRLNAVQLNNNESGLRLAHSDMKLLAELINLCPWAELCPTSIGCKTKRIWFSCYFSNSSYRRTTRRHPALGGLPGMLNIAWIRLSVEVTNLYQFKPRFFCLKFLFMWPLVQENMFVRGNKVHVEHCGV